MRVEILQVLDPSRGIVRFKCEYGDVSGRWRGSKPAGLGKFDVEIDVPEEVEEWDAASSEATPLSEIPGAEHAVLIVGSVVRFDNGDDSVVEIRVGSDVLLVEIENRRSQLLVDGFISFHVSEIQLYPYDL